MKSRHAMALAAALGFAFTMAASADQAFLTATTKSMPGLVGHWTFEGDYRDVSGNGHDGKVADPAGITWVAGVKGGKAVMIDSKTVNKSFIDIPAPIGSKFDGPKATAVAWVKLAPVDGWQAILERNNLWYLETENHATDWKENAVVWRIYDAVAVGGGGSGQVRDNAKIVIKNDKWHQLGWTYDGAVMKCYVDGAMVISKEYAGGLPPTAATPATPPAGKGTNYNLSVGTWQQRDDWFKGAVDDFSYFTAVLTDAQIKSLYESMLAAPAAVEPAGKLATMWGATKVE